MNLKEKIDNPRLWQLITSILTAVLGYFGYQQIEHRAPDVDVEVVVPGSEVHSHPQHAHKDWLPVIDAELEKARKNHSNAYHGGD